jgi:hypothetical protein
MKKQNKHSDENFIKGFGAWMLFEFITRTKMLDDFLTSKSLDAEGREDAYKILKVFSFSVIVEGLLIEQMYNQYENFEEEKRAKIKKDILEQIKRNHYLKGSAADEEAEVLLQNQLSESQKIIIPPVLQYTAGYTMGGLINLAIQYFDIDITVISKLKEFKEDRNYIFHNPTSSRDNLDEIVERIIKTGEELIILLNTQTKEVD